MNENSNVYLIKPEESEEKFLSELNKATGFSNSFLIPHLKFNGETGMWMRETDKKDEENKPIYEELAESIKFQIITTRNMVQSTFSSDKGYYSREYTGSYTEIYNKQGEVIMKGLYKNLKEQDPDLSYIQVLYVYFEEKPYRVKLGGIKLSNLFPYLASYKGSNPALFETIASRGEKKKKGSVTYYELNFNRGEAMDRDLIIERVNAVNTFLNAYQQMRASKDNKGNPGGEEIIYLDDEPIPLAPNEYMGEEGEINVNGITF